MNVFLTKLLFHIHSEEGTPVSEFDEQFRVVKACSAEEAFIKARAIGMQEEESFLSGERELLHWTFVDVMEVFAMDTYANGDLIFSTTRQEEDHESYIAYIRQRSLEAQIKHLTFA